MLTAATLKMDKQCRVGRRALISCMIPRRSKAKRISIVVHDYDATVGSKSSSSVENGGRESRWVWVRNNLAAIVEFGQQQPNQSYNEIEVLINPVGVHGQEVGYQRRRDNWEINIPVHETSLMHQAIPFLPIPAAVICLILNIFLPGLGTILSGFFLICVGHPRIQVKEGRVILTVIVNFLVGIAQAMTITLLLVGWCWSIAWGSILITHSLQYRDALHEKRKAQIATVALEAITKNTLLRQRNVRNLIKQDRKDRLANKKKKHRRSLAIWKTKSSKKVGILPSRAATLPVLVNAPPLAVDNNGEDQDENSGEAKVEVDKRKKTEILRATLQKRASDAQTISEYSESPATEAVAVVDDDLPSNTTTPTIDISTQQQQKKQLRSWQSLLISRRR